MRYENNELIFFQSELSKPTIDEDYIEHHGILGQKWGKKQGPPYPLGAEDHSAKEKKEGYKKSIGGGRNEELYDRKSKKKDTSKFIKKRRSSLEYEQLGEAYKKKEKDKKEVEDYRERMLEKYEKKDPETAKFYKEADEETLQMDMEHKENVKKALIATAAVVGVAASAYLIYKYRLNKNLEVASSGSDDLKSLVKDGMSMETASKILTVDMGGELLRETGTKKKIMKGLANEMDVILKDPQFAKTTFGNPMRAVKDVEYVAFTKDDVRTYATRLRDWEEEIRTGLRGSKRDTVINLLKSTSDEFKIPSTKKQSEIIDDLIASDPEILKQVEDSLTSMTKRAYKAAGYDMSKGLYDAFIRGDSKAEIKRDQVAATVHAMVDHNPYLEKKISEAFTTQGYGGMLDLFDSKVLDSEGFTDLPIIAFKEMLKLKT